MLNTDAVDTAVGTVRYINYYWVTARALTSALALFHPVPRKSSSEPRDSRTRLSSLARYDEEEWRVPGKRGCREGMIARALSVYHRARARAYFEDRRRMFLRSHGTARFAIQNPTLYASPSPPFDPPHRVKRSRIRGDSLGERIRGRESTAVAACEQAWPMTRCVIVARPLAKPFRDASVRNDAV